MHIAKISAVAAVVTAMAPAAAHAGVYASVNVGGASPADVSAVVYAPSGAIFGEGAVVAAAAVPAGSDSIEGKFDLKPAMQVSGAIGYDFGLVRAEAEVAYSRHSVRALNVTKLTGFGGSTTNLQDGAGDACAYLGVATCPTSGNSIAYSGQKIRQLAGMANVWIDLPIGGPIEPFVGGGIGVVGLENDGEARSAFAWQLGGGVAYKLAGGLALTADVRYRSVNEISFDFGGSEGLNFGRLKTTTYGVGLRYSF